MYDIIIKQSRDGAKSVGAYGIEGTPVPIPNTVVKLNSVEDTWMATSRENRTVPTL